MLSCRVLGPTEVDAGAARVDLGGPLPRRLITALVAAEGRPVGDDRLADAVWGAAVPPRADASLQAYVSRLRRSLGADRDALQRTAAGYRLVLVDGATDVAAFVAGVESGRTLLLADRPGEALRVFGAALARWRGDAYADLPETPEVAAARGRLDELRAVAVEERLAARLATGDAPGAVAELDAAVRATPYRERRWELLILGLYRCGRQGDALAALRRVRTLLADELGVDPGPGLQRMERLLLAQDPRLLLPVARAAGPARTPPVSRPLSTFLGRQAELAALTGLVGAHRLVTLVGPGGAGKTRLAVEYAADADGTSGAGPWLARLADVADAPGLAPAVATAVGVHEVSGDPIAAVTGALAGRSGLLVLDNCEHLTADVAALVLRLLGACPGLRVLATGREPLGVDGERTLPVAPLPPDAAVELLVDRIRTIRPGWAPDTAERGHLVKLAAALDGIPLALELAAARARVLGLQELTEHLDDRFAVLGAVPRGTLAPHATLEAAIAWSIDLLSPADRALLGRLWPYEGGFTLEALQSGTPTLESLSSLVTRSVVVADTTVSPTRYRLLELIRSYTRGRDPDPDSSRATHAAWVRALAERSERDLRGERSAYAIRMLRREWPNLRAAIVHDLAHAPAAALRTAGLLDWFWYRGGHVAEGYRLMQAALAAAPDAPVTDRARAWASCGALRFIAGDIAGAAYCLARMSELLVDPQDREGRVLLGQVRYYEAIMLASHGDPAAARKRAEESVAIGRETGEEWIVAGGEMSLGAALVGLGETAHGQEVLARARHRAVACGQNWAAAMADLLLARSLLSSAAGVTEALPVLRRARRIFSGEDDVSNVLACLWVGSYALVLAGRADDGARLLTAVRRHAVRRGLRPEATDPALATALNTALHDRPAVDEDLDEDAMIALLDDGGVS